MSFTFSRSDFPQGFLFGTATAAYQIEGSAYGGCGSSHWDTYAATPGNVAGADDGFVACDHYHRFEDDFDLVREGGFDAYRFSTSWARVMPDGKTINPEGLDFYDRLAEAICARGLKPYLTLYHWDLPSALADIGGWMNRETPERFADFTNAVIGRIGDRMEAVATINEPWCVSFLSHFLGAHAPGLRDVRATARAMHHVLLAHGLSMQAMRAAGQENLGIVLNLTDAQAASDSEADREAAHTLDGIHNRWFLDAVFKGTYPEDIVAGLDPHMPAGFQEDLPVIGASIDWLGVNYYTRGIVAADPGTPWPRMQAVEGPLDKTQMEWEIYPEGLTKVLTRVHQDYAGDLPMVVTENGMAWADEVENGAVYDPVRMDYLSSHLKATHDAMQAGANMRGFFYWSLLDNYEWAYGYEKRFGLIHVDYDSQVRTPKASFKAWAAALNA